MEEIKERVNQILEYTANTLNAKFDKSNEVMNLKNSLVVIESKLKVLKHIIEK